MHLNPLKGPSAPRPHPGRLHRCEGTPKGQPTQPMFPKQFKCPHDFRIGGADRQSKATSEAVHAVQEGLKPQEFPGEWQQSNIIGIRQGGEPLAKIVLHESCSTVGYTVPPIFLESDIMYPDMGRLRLI